LVTSPVNTVKKILKVIPNSPPLRLITPIPPSRVRQNREELNLIEIQTISAVCGEVANEFGYIIEL
jgi:hypothetical protein